MKTLTLTPEQITLWLSLKERSSSVTPAPLKAQLDVHFNDGLIGVFDIIAALPPVVRPRLLSSRGAELSSLESREVLLGKYAFSDHHQVVIVAEGLSLFNVQCGYASYHASTQLVEAISAESACDAAIKIANDDGDWRSLDDVGDTYVDAIAKGDRGPWSTDDDVPERFTEARIHLRTISNKSKED